MLKTDGTQVYWDASIDTSTLVHKVGDSMTGDLSLVVSSN